MKYLLILIFCLFGKIVSAQELVFGKVTTEEHVDLQGVVVINLNTDEKVQTDRDGNFMIRGKVKDELRTSSPRYERVSVTLSAEDFRKPLHIIVKRIPYEIEEVEIKYQVTGDLKKDVQHLGEARKVKILKTEIAKDIALGPRPNIPRAHGEFVQPVGPGFSIGKVKNQWDDVDFMNFLIREIPDDFFTEDLKLTKPEISFFILYVFKDYERKNILKNGNPGYSDVMRFMQVSERKIVDYKSNK